MKKSEFIHKIVQGIVSGKATLLHFDLNEFSENITKIIVDATKFADKIEELVPFDD